VRHKKFPEAERFLRMALEQDHTFAPAYLGLGELHRGREDHHQALAQFQAAVQMRPSLVPGLIGLANSYLALKRYDEAVATFKKVLEISPQFVPALNNLAWTYAEQGQNLGEALSLAQQARQLAL